MADLVNETIPQNSESPTLGAQRIRETRAGFNDLIGAEHDITDDATTSGFHGTNVTGKADTAITDPPTGYGRFGWKVISGVTEMFYRDDAGNEKQITSAGVLLSQLQDTDTDLSGKSYFLDEDDMASDDATKVASQQSINAFASLDPDGVLMHDAEGSFVNADVNGTKTKVYTKYLTGTLNSSSSENIAHGVANGLTKILSVTFHAFSDSSFNYYVVAEYRQNTSASLVLELGFNDTNIVLSAKGSSIVSNGYKIKVEYIL